VRSKREEHLLAVPRARAVSKYVKFTHERAGADIPAFAALSELNAFRRKLLELQLIGVDSNGVSFGNLSIRDGETKSFYITGSATGTLPELTRADCARVLAYDFERNWIRYDGVAIPSSESLTHAAIYESDPAAAAVIHCHDSRLWLSLLNEAPTASKAAQYGTPEMAREIMQLFKTNDLQRRKILVMAGHEGGIVTFGKHLEDAFDILLSERKEVSTRIEQPYSARGLTA
jgi:L-ribulose-5-phosphate 4-epimerase